MKAARRFDRTSPTTVISTVVVLAAMVIALLALLIFAPTSSAGPAEDCAAVRARDHQIYPVSYTHLTLPTKRIV